MPNGRGDHLLLAAETYGVPIVGGHTSYGCEDRQLGVSVLGQAQHLPTSYDATPGEVLPMDVGVYFEDYPFWNASTDASARRLQCRFELEREERLFGGSAKFECGAVPR